MAAFKLWARVHQLGPQRYGAIVAAVPAVPGAGPRLSDIRRDTFSSPHVAELTMQLMSQSLRDVLLARGDRITAAM